MPSALELLAQLLAAGGGGEAAQILRGASLLMRGLKGLSQSMGGDAKKAVDAAINNQSMGQLLQGMGNATIPTARGTIQITQGNGGTRIQLPQQRELFLPTPNYRRGKFIGGGFGGSGATENMPPAPPGAPPAEPPSQPAGQPSGQPSGKGGIKGAIQLQRVQSSNVYAIGYDEEVGRLRIQFLAGGHGLSKAGKERAKTKPGSTYDYYNVPSKLWGSFQSAPSKGRWVWDNLRIRGTVAGHKFDYSLVSGETAGITSAGKARMYIPRLATASVVRGSGQGRPLMARQTFKKRTMIVSGSPVSSQLPTQLVSVRKLGKTRRAVFSRGR